MLSLMGLMLDSCFNPVRFIEFKQWNRLYMEGRRAPLNGKDKPDKTNFYRSFFSYPKKDYFLLRSLPITYSKKPPTMNDHGALKLTIERFSSFIEPAKNMPTPYNRLKEALNHEGMQPTIRLLSQSEGSLELAKDLKWFISRFVSITYEYNTCPVEFIISFVQNEAIDLAEQLGKLIKDKTRPITGSPSLKTTSP